MERFYLSKTASNYTLCFSPVRLFSRYLYNFIIFQSFWALKSFFSHSKFSSSFSTNQTCRKGLLVGPSHFLPLHASSCNILQAWIYQWQSWGRGDIELSNMQLLAGTLSPFLATLSQGKAVCRQTSKYWLSFVGTFAFSGGYYKAIPPSSLTWEIWMLISPFLSSSELHFPPRFLPGGLFIPQHFPAEDPLTTECPWLLVGQWWSQKYDLGLNLQSKPGKFRFVHPCLRTYCLPVLPVSAALFSLDPFFTPQQQQVLYSLMAQLSILHQFPTQCDVEREAFDISDLVREEQKG